MIAYYVFAILAILPYASWLALLCLPGVIVISPLLLAIAAIVSLFSFITGGLGSLAFVYIYGVLVLLAIFGEIFLIPLAIVSPLSVAASAITYYFSLNT